MEQIKLIQCEFSKSLNFIFITFYVKSTFFLKRMFFLNKSSNNYSEPNFCIKARAFFYYLFINTEIYTSTTHTHKLNHKTFIKQSVFNIITEIIIEKDE